MNTPMKTLTAPDAGENARMLSPEEEQVFNALAEAGWNDDIAIDMIIENRLTADDEGTPDSIRRFSVQDRSSANWVLKQIAQANADIDEIQRMIDAEIDSIKLRGQRILKPLQDKIRFFEAAYSPQLEDWARKELQGKKAKSLSLIHGKVGFRKSPDKVVIDADDEEHAIGYLKGIGLLNCIRVKEEINKTELRKVLEEGPLPYTGIAHLETGSDSFYMTAEVPRGED